MTYIEDTKPEGNPSIFAYLYRPENFRVETQDTSAPQMEESEKVICFHLLTFWLLKYKMQVEDVAS